MEGVLSLVSHEYHFCQLDEGFSFRGWSQLADLSCSFMAVALGEVGRLLHTITLMLEDSTTERVTDQPPFASWQIQWAVLKSVSTLNTYLYAEGEKDSFYTR